MPSPVTSVACSTGSWTFYPFRVSTVVTSAAWLCGLLSVRIVVDMPPLNCRWWGVVFQLMAHLLGFLDTAPTTLGSCVVPSPFNWRCWSCTASLKCTAFFALSSVSSGLSWRRFDMVLSLIPTTILSHNISYVKFPYSQVSTNAKSLEIYHSTISPGNWLRRLNIALSNITFLLTLRTRQI